MTTHLSAPPALTLTTSQFQDLAEVPPEIGGLPT